MVTVGSLQIGLERYHEMIDHHVMGEVDSFAHDDGWVVSRSYMLDAHDDGCDRRLAAIKRWLDGR